MFDRRLLPPARFEFLVITDTHYMLADGAGATEFKSRGTQTARAETALRIAKELKADLVLHLGDLVQEYPDTEKYRQAIDEAREQIARVGIEMQYVPGNHDIGDKPDPIMPTSPVTAESLAWYHEQFGPSWRSFDFGGCHFVLLNSQLFNSNLPQREEQRVWLEADLRDRSSKRTFLFLHLPPYLWNEHEPALGHYEILDQPDRAWLLDLVQRHAVELMVAGHVHTTFYDHYGRTRYLIANSTSFTRPGFCQMYTSGPLADRGRDDVGKLGCYLFRVFGDRVDVHFIPTGGATELPATPSDRRKRLITRVPANCKQRRVGLSLRQAITPTAEVPLAWPGAIREPIRNDYPLLASLEMGASSIRTQWMDLADPMQSRRLEILRELGVEVTATMIWSTRCELNSTTSKHAGQFDDWELQIAGDPMPTEACLDDLRGFRESISSSLSLSAVVPGEVLPGKQQPRTRHGFKCDELARLNACLQSAHVPVDRVRCHVLRNQTAWDFISDVEALGELDHIGAIDLLIEMPGLNDAENAARAAESLFATTRLAGSRVYFDPLVDLDRSMDVVNGLLDTICNPRPVFHVVRCLNSVLESFAGATPIVASRTGQSLILKTDGTVLQLLPKAEQGTCELPEDSLLFRLVEGTVAEYSHSSTISATGPLLVVTTNSAL